MKYSRPEVQLNIRFDNLDASLHVKIIPISFHVNKFIIIVKITLWITLFSIFAKHFSEKEKI